MTLRPKVPQELNENTAMRVFDELEARTDHVLTADITGIPAETIGRLASAKRLIESGVPQEQWPKRLRDSWPRLIPQIVGWHERWQAGRDASAPGARRRHTDLLVQLGLAVQKALEPPVKTGWLLIGEMYWDPPLVPAKVSVPPRFQFQVDPEFFDLVSHIPGLGRALPGIQSQYVRYSAAFKALKARAQETLIDTFPGLPRGEPTQALVGALLSEAISLTRFSDAALNTVQLEPGEVAGLRNARVAGRLAAGLDPKVADDVANGFHDLVRQVVQGGVLADVYQAFERLGEVLAKARDLVRSESVIRLAVAAGSCASCRGHARSGPDIASSL